MRQVLQSVTSCYCKVRYVLQSVTYYYHIVDNVLQSVTTITKWDKTTFVASLYLTILIIFTQVQITAEATFHR